MSEIQRIANGDSPMANPGSPPPAPSNQLHMARGDINSEEELDEEPVLANEPNKRLEWAGGKNPAGRTSEENPSVSSRNSFMPPITQPYFAPANTHPQTEQEQYDDNPFALPPPDQRKKIPTQKPLRIPATKSLSMSISRSPTPTPVQPEAGCRNLPSIFVGYEGAKHNPHFAKTRQGTAPRLPGPNAHPYTDAVFERLVFSDKILMANISEHQTGIIESDPEAVRIIFSLSASHSRNLKTPRWGEEIAERIKTWGFDDDLLEIVEAVPKGPVGRGKSNQPYVWILVHASDETLAVLDWQQTFAFDEEHVCFSMKLGSGTTTGHWIVETLGGARITANSVTMKTVLDNTYADLIKNETFKTITHRIYRLQGLPGTPEDHAKHALDTLSILHVHARDHSTGAPRPLWLVMCEPITDDVRDHNLWVKCFRDLTYHNGMTQFTHPWTAGGININCELCKSTTHLQYECPQTGVPGWMGPVTETGVEFEQRLNAPKESRPARPAQGRQRGGFKPAGRGGKHK